MEDTLFNKQTENPSSHFICTPNWLSLQNTFQTGWLEICHMFIYKLAYLVQKMRIKNLKTRGASLKFYFFHMRGTNTARGAGRLVVLVYTKLFSLRRCLWQWHWWKGRMTTPKSARYTPNKMLALSACEITFLLLKNDDEDKNLRTNMSEWAQNWVTMCLRLEHWCLW